VLNSQKTYRSGFREHVKDAWSWYWDKSAGLRRDVLNAPNELLWADARELDFAVPLSGELRTRSVLGYSLRVVGLIREGDWDLLQTSFSDDPHFLALRQRFVENLSWEETEYFRIFHAAVKTRGQHRGFGTWNAFHNACLLHWDNLYATLKSEAARSGKFPVYGRPDEQIETVVDRSVRLCFLDGKHRLAMARLLDVSSVPVICNVWHKSYIDAMRLNIETPLSPLSLLPHIHY
jgi:hypothetical protein